MALPPQPTPQGTAVTGSTADKLAGAQEKAATLRAKVAELEIQAALAADDEAVAQERLAETVTAELSATVAYDSSVRRSERSRSMASERVRALYRTGGQDSLLAAVLTAPRGELSELQADLRTLRTLVDSDRNMVEESNRAAEKANSDATKLTQLREERLAREAETRNARERLLQAVSVQQTLLNSADTEVKTLLEQQKRELEQQRLLAYRSSSGVDIKAQLALLGSQDGTDVDRKRLEALDTPTPAAKAAILAAAEKLGRPYVWGATGPETFDCSGLTQWSFRNAGVAIPRTSRQQQAGLPSVPLENAQPGDLMFFGKSAATVHHVGIYLGSGVMLHAPHTGDVVRMGAVWREDLFAAARPQG